MGRGSKQAWNEEEEEEEEAEVGQATKQAGDEARKSVWGEQIEMRQWPLAKGQHRNTQNCTT